MAVGTYSVFPLGIFGLPRGSTYLMIKELAPQIMIDMGFKP